MKHLLVMRFRLSARQIGQPSTQICQIRDGSP